MSNIFLYVLAMMSIVSAILIFRMNKVLWGGIVAASFVAGVLYWIEELFPYIFYSLVRSRIPYDAIFVFIPTVFAVAIISLLISPFLVFLLNRMGGVNVYCVPLIAAIEGGAVARFVRPDYTLQKLFVMSLIGFFSGCVFLWLSSPRSSD